MDASFDDDMLKELMEQNQKLEQELAGRLGGLDQKGDSRMLKSKNEDEKGELNAKSAKTTKELPEDKKEIAPEFSMNKSNDSLVNETSKKPPAIPPQPSATVSRANDDVHVDDQAGGSRASGDLTQPGSRIRRTQTTEPTSSSGPVRKPVRPREKMDKSDFDSFLDDFANAEQASDTGTPQHQPPLSEVPSAAGAPTTPQQTQHKLPSNAFTAEWDPPPRRRSVVSMTNVLSTSSGPSNKPLPTKHDLFSSDDQLPHMAASEAAPFSASPSLSARDSPPPPLPLYESGISALSLQDNPESQIPTQKAFERRKLFGGVIEDPKSFRTLPGVASTAAVAELKAESGRLTGLLAAAESKARRLQEELDASAADKRKRILDIEEERVSDRERWEVQQRRLEADVQRLHDNMSEEHRRFADLKKRQKETLDVEREELKREWEHKVREEKERVRKAMQEENEQLAQRHRRHVESLTEQHSRELEVMRVQTRSSVDFTDVLDRMADTSLQVESLARRLDGSASLHEDSVKAQLEIRERNVKQLERFCEEKLAEVEQQRRKVTAVLEQMQDDRSVGESQQEQQRERLDRDHQRVLDILAAAKEKERLTALREEEERAQLEEERRRFKLEEENTRNELNQIKSENDVTRRKLIKERDALDNLRRQVEQANMNCQRRINETETLVASERRNLMVDLEVIGERERALKNEIEVLEQRRQNCEMEELRIAEETKRLSIFAAEISHKSEDICSLYQMASAVKSESQRLHGEMVENKREMMSEKTNLKSLHTLVEHQRLQLMQETTVQFSRDVIQPSQIAPPVLSDSQNQPDIPMIQTTSWAQPPPKMKRENLESQLEEWRHASEQTRERIAQVSSTLKQVHPNLHLPLRATVGRDISPFPPLSGLPIPSHMETMDGMTPDGMETPPQDLAPSQSLRTLEPLPSDDGLMA
eukprot:GEMP01001910.1.p1 GENE.GEMP01001910.1~~GEMP01001910.1.p1  ORF type:complete len:1049 (+),score=314.21 GEMP01001910.1:341-3148(+)